MISEIEEKGNHSACDVMVAWVIRRILRNQAEQVRCRVTISMVDANCFRKIMMEATA